MAPRKPKLPAHLELVAVELRSFYRIYASAFPDPLGYGKGPSRFGDPRKELTDEERFGVLYLGEGLAVAFAETLIRSFPRTCTAMGWGWNRREVPASRAGVRESALALPPSRSPLRRAKQG